MVGRKWIGFEYFRSLFYLGRGGLRGPREVRRCSIKPLKIGGIKGSGEHSRGTSRWLRRPTAKEYSEKWGKIPQRREKSLKGRPPGGK